MTKLRRISACVCGSACWKLASVASETTTHPAEGVIGPVALDHHDVVPGSACFIRMEK